MDPLLVDIAAACARWALTLAVGWLVSHHVVPADQSAPLLDKLLPVLTSKAVLVLGAALPLVWSVRQKIVARLHLNTALELPPGATVADVNTAIKSGRGAGALISVVLLAVVLGGGVLTTAACAPKTWKSQTQQVFNEKTVIEGLVDLQHVAIGLAETDVISIDDAGFVVAGVQSLLDGHDAGGAGWPSTVRATLVAFVGNPTATPKPIAPRLGGAAIDKLGPKIRSLLPLLDVFGGAQ